MKNNGLKYLYIFTLLFFLLGIINIIFAWVGFACMILPFVLLIKDKKKTWCQKYCPRASLLSTLFRKKKGIKVPKWLASQNTKRIVLSYFCINMFFITMSTIMVSLGRIEAIDKVRFLIAFQFPWDLPQLISISNIPDWIIHLSYRIYSMMFTSTVIGVLFGLLFKPRTWCTVCPISTLSGDILKRYEKN